MRANPKRVIDDYKSVSINTGGKTEIQKMAMDKGHQEEIIQWGQSINQGKPSPISWPEIRAVTLASILAVRSIREGQAFDF